MAVLKMQTEYDNVIYLTDVIRIEKLVFGDVDPRQENRPDAFGAIQKSIEAYKDKDILRYNILKNKTGCIPIRSIFTKLPDDLVNVLLLNVIVERHDVEQSELWIVIPGKNFLLENGKTVDRL